MGWIHTSIFLPSLVLLLSAVPVSLARAAGQPGDVALGDSIDFGIGSSTGAGWVVPFHAYLEAVFGTAVDLDNLAAPGAETTDIDQQQLAPAVSDVSTHAPYGVVVTIGGGGNDLRHFIASPEAHACLEIRSCLARINALLDEAEQRMDLALKELRAAGPNATMLVRTQYNALRGTGCATPDRVALADAALEAPPGSAIRDGGLNWRLRAVAARHGAKVVEIFLPFAFFGDAVLVGDCIHPNDAGYQLILFEAVSAFTRP